jgi:predicted alpha/beta superfamily hydrolase
MYPEPSERGLNATPSNNVNQMPTRTITYLSLISISALAYLGLAWGGPTTTRVAAQVSIPGTRRIEFVSRVNGHLYEITLAFPFTRAPLTGYPVLYVLDGYWYFASATEAVRLVAAGSNVLVVGIGYPDDRVYVQHVLAERGPLPDVLKDRPPSRGFQFLEREYDLTLPASDADLATQTFPGDPQLRGQNVGGLDDFLKIIETEIKPRVAALAHIDPANQALFGHSLGGLATLHALFTEPNAFRTFIIGSPSIWWNNREVLADEERFAAAVRAGEASPRVLVTMGSEESSIPPKSGADQSVIAAFYRRTRMVENGAELVEKLKKLRGNAGYRVDGYALFDKEAHSEAAWSALARGIPFAFGDDAK